MPPHLCHHRQVPWLAGDLPWCKVGVRIPSTAMRRRIPQWGLGKGSTSNKKKRESLRISDLELRIKSLEVVYSASKEDHILNELRKAKPEKNEIIDKQT